MFQSFIKKFFVLFSLVLPFYAQAQINVFTCEPEWAALTQALGGGNVAVTSATTAMQDPHHIQARPSLISKVRQADFLVCTGAGLEEGWLPLLLRKSGNPNVQLGQIGQFMAANYTQLLEKPTILDRSQGHIHSAGNPHFHLDPARIISIAPALTDALINVDPANQLQYQTNLALFTQQWQQAMKRWKQISQPLQGKRVVVSHNNWGYLLRWLGMERIATLEPLPGVPPSSAHLSKLLAKQKQIPADMILNASYQNARPARWLSEHASIPIATLPLSPSVNESLFQWFDRLLNQILSAK